MASDGFDPLHLLSFVAGVVLSVGVAGAAYYVLMLQRRSLAKAVCKEAKDCSSTKKAWSDLEMGELKKPSVTAGNFSSSQQSPEQLCETLRALLEEEITKGCHTQDLSDRMARLEKQLAEMSRSSRTKGKVEAMPPVGLRGAAAVSLLEVDPDGHGALDKSLKSAASDTRTPSSSDRSSNSEREKEVLPGIVATPPEQPPNAALEEAMPPHAPPAELDTTKAPVLDPEPLKLFGPTVRQTYLAEPPERGPPFLDEEEADRNSLITLQRVLGKRDAQTTELHHQLREARQQLWQQTTEARAATTRLHNFLMDKSQAPQAQAEAIIRLQDQVKDLSGRLAESHQQEQHWSAIAKRQRAFFQQSERMSQDCMSLLRRHPAGDVFLAPPPVVLEDDEPRDEPMWDVGTSHCNPYCVDSWPFEPNVLKARASAQPNLNRWEEGTDEDYEEDRDDEDEQDHLLHCWHPQDAHKMDEDDDEEEEEEISDGHGGWNEAMPMQRHGVGLPPLSVAAGGSETSRSL
eukprot:TRINITY_DN77601_c0_g1_i1.p1 TRINITY_DN77601_c0_g1~~TRINITY_DN77601_c0_g1_i1.p1  ORF type:complete len:516 (+),score=129.70 TRINITY_DN77601_c0_g1_i1:95-1642(+)